MDPANTGIVLADFLAMSVNQGLTDVSNLMGDVRNEPVNVRQLMNVPAETRIKTIGRSYQERPNNSDIAQLYVNNKEKHLFQTRQVM
jgi:hypothetical protein